MTSKQFRRGAAVIFTFASVGFLLETMAEKNGPLVEILFGLLLATFRDCLAGVGISRKPANLDFVDTLGVLLGVRVLPANIQDRDGVRDLLRQARRRFPFVERIFADAGYQGPKMASVVAGTGWGKIEIVKRSDLHRFVVLPKRWIVERTFAWISRNQRLMRDFERHAATVAACVRLAMIRLMLKRLTKPNLCS